MILCKAMNRTVANELFSGFGSTTEAAGEVQGGNETLVHRGRVPCAGGGVLHGDAKASVAGLVTEFGK